MKQAEVWRQMLTDLHPKAVTQAEKERVELVDAMFQREARPAMMLLLSELDRALEHEKRLERELAETKRKLTNANRVITDVRAKNKKLRERKK